MKKWQLTFISVLLLLSLSLFACSAPVEEDSSPAAGETDNDTGDDGDMEDEDHSDDADGDMAEDDAAMAEDGDMEEDAMAEDDCASDNLLCVGVVTDVGEIDDKSFNQSAWEGVQQAEADMGAKVDFIETKDAKDYATNIGLFADQGYDVIVTVGFAMGEATAIAAAEYPAIDFIGVDQFQGAEIPNVAGLIFNEDRAGFMAGALAGRLTESNTIASVLGTDLVPPVVAFGEGFELGAQHVNPDINVITTYHPGGLDVAFTDPEWGAATARQALDNGADVVFAAGGKTGNGGLIEVASADGAFCIGVDTDQWETVPEAHSCLVSSAMKLIKPGVFDLISMSDAGSFPGGNFFGDVGLADFHDFDSTVSDEIKAELAAIDAALRDGSMTTGYGEAVDNPNDGEEMAEEDDAMMGDMMMSEDGECADEATLCVGVVTDVGEIDDKSFNQSAWEGVLRAQDEIGAQVDFIETQDAKDYATNIALFADNGYDIIVTVGFAMGEATAIASQEYPDIDFIGVDQFQGEAIDNVAGVIFNEDKAGFLAGALAAMLSESGSIAAVLGTDLVPPVVAFGEGYLNGAAYINPEIEAITTYHPGGLDVAFTDPEWGAATARQALDNGADVIFAAGGKTGNGGLIEVAGADGAFCIGVDTDQWETVPEAHSCLVSSAMKLITPAVFDLIAMSWGGEFASGNFVGSVGLAPFHDFDASISDEIKTTLAEIDAGLQDGSIETGYGQ